MKQVVVRLAISESTNVNNSIMPDVCLQHMIAVMLIDKTVSFRAAHDRQRMQDPAILRQRAKVMLVTDEELETRRPAREAIVEVTLSDGALLREHVEAVRGTAENPMTREEVVAKSRTLMEPTMGETRCARLIEKVFELANVKDIRELRPLISKDVS